MPPLRLRQGRNFCFTYANPAMNLDEFSVQMAGWPHIRGGIVADEVGAGGLHHFQGYVEFDVPVKPLPLIREYCPGAHWENRVAERTLAIHYCMKPVVGCNMDEGKECKHCIDARAIGQVANFVCVGSLKSNQGQRSDLAAMIADVREGESDLTLADKYPVTFFRTQSLVDQFRARLQSANVKRLEQPPYVCLVTGPSGSGKSFYVESRFGDDQLYVVGYPPSHSHMFHGTEEARVKTRWHFEEYRGQLKHDQFFQLIGRQPLQVFTKGVLARYRPSELFITTQVPPALWYPRISADERKSLCRRITHLVILNVHHEIVLDTKDPLKILDWCSHFEGPWPDLMGPGHFD